MCPTIAPTATGSTQKPRIPTAWGRGRGAKRSRITWCSSALLFPGCPATPVISPAAVRLCLSVVFRPQQQNRAATMFRFVFFSRPRNNAIKEDMAEKVGICSAGTLLCFHAIFLPQQHVGHVSEAADIEALRRRQLEDSLLLPSSSTQANYHGPKTLKFKVMSSKSSNIQCLDILQKPSPRSHSSWPTRRAGRLKTPHPRNAALRYRQSSVWYLSRALTKQKSSPAWAYNHPTPFHQSSN